MSAQIRGSLPPTATAPAAPPTKLEDLDSGQKLAASLYVLSRDDMPVPAAPSLRELAAMGGDDIKRALQRIKNGDPHRFANLFGSIGGTGGALVASTLGKVLGNRERWTATLVGTVLGTYPPAFAGYAIDRLIDP